jgi:hypothetical protein
MLLEGQVRAARGELAAALRLDPNFTAARDLLERIAPLPDSP